MVSLVIPKVRGQLSAQTVIFKIFWWHGLLTLTGLRASTSQAERMVERNRVDLQAGEQGEDVTVLVAPVDCGRGDPRNILGVKIDRREDRDQYRWP
ncbi:hypothetical protein PoB_005050600 [Plakobranchus ocellatus]|uniref:Uncharacterized protein n=1 Tax=Plakobranchus ocellatus TaxID=259542 RepID=A0AAV4BY11_9GAST|nr:hypothetical protein PoB_005050600 [Plakobranchus ocellatus]